MVQQYTYATISVGGSIINPGTIDVGFLKGFREVILNDLTASNGKKKFIIICGGGAAAREYIRACPPGLSPGQIDYLGIMPTWVNAQLLSAWFSGYCPPIPGQDFHQFLQNASLYLITIAGGFLPALKTDEDSAVAADFFASPYLINITNVDGVYDKDPKKFSEAKKFTKMSYQQFHEMFGGRTLDPGASAPFAEVAVRLCERTKMRIFVIGKEMSVLREALRGNCQGTEIGP